jgi:Resolvase, N terminal domain
VSDKIKLHHLERKAILYVRQSSAYQVQNNLESQKLQYAMRDRLCSLGWHEIEIVDEDLGRTASGTVTRVGFERMVAEVCLGHVGAVAAREVSRFARNSREWQKLVEVCRVVDTLLIDQEMVYTPRQSNDRLLLGLNRPETQSTSHSTFCWTTSFGSVVPFRTRTLLAPVKTVPPADIPDVLTGETPTKGTAQAGTIERSGDFCIGAPRRHFVNLGNSFFWRF